MTINVYLKQHHALWERFGKIADGREGKHIHSITINQYSTRYLIYIHRESDWLVHCKSVHTKKILENQERFSICWSFESLKNHGGPIVAYYLIQLFNETFNLYQIHEVKTCKQNILIFFEHYQNYSCIL